MYLYGKNSVLERIKADPKSIKKIFTQDNFNSAEITALIKSKNIPTESVSEKRLLKIKRADRLQGIVADVNDFRHKDFDELLEESARKRQTLICLDNINDPHNLGAIIRTAACFGGFAVVIPRHNSCGMNDTVMHVASGGENFVPVSLVSNLPTALLKAKKKNFWIVGTVVEDGEDITALKLPFPLCVVLGSEGKGIRPGVEKQLDIKVRVPMKGPSLSFNVAVASGIFCYEAVRQRQAHK